MIIKTYNPTTLAEKETVTKITSNIWNSRFYDTGSFEIHTTQNQFNVGDIIAFKTSTIHSGIVMKIVEELDDIAVSGYDMKGLFEFRYINALQTYTGQSPEAIIKDLAETYLKTGDRSIDKLTVAENQNRWTATDYTIEKKHLSAALKDFCTANEVGISIDFDLSGFTLETLKGADKTSTVLFGRRFRNIDKIEYTKDRFNTYNVCYSKDENDEETVTGAAAGIERREGYSDKNPAEYLSAKAEIETLKAEANEKYIYGVDYSLGDYVSVIHNGLSTIKQITEVKEVYERGKTIILPVFGTEKENPLKKVLRGD